jgi:hypothetical protein
MSKEEEHLDEISDADDDEEIQKPVKPKRVLNENQRKAVALNLAKGREKLKLKKQAQIEERNKQIESKKELKNTLIIKKADKLIKEKQKMKKQIGLEEDDEDDETPVIVVKKKKPQKIVYVEDDEEEEEPVYVKRVKKVLQPIETPKPIEEPKQINQPFRVRFY